MSSWVSVVIFYSLVVILIYINRKKFEFQGKIIALYKTKIGIKLMKKITNFFPGFLNIIGFAGIIIGYVGLFWISYLLIKGFLQFFIKPAAAPVLGLVLPGITTPLWYTLISIFIVATVHEFSHGVMSTLYKIKVKNTGIVFFGPIFGAFVEPDEKKLAKTKKLKQLAVFAAGPASNIIMALALIFLFGFSLPNMDFFGLDMGISHNITSKTAIIDLTELTPQIINYGGLEIKAVSADSAAQKAGLKKNMLITKINNISIKNETAFFKEITELVPNKTIYLYANEKQYSVIPKADPKNSTRGIIGINFKMLPKYSDWALNKFGVFGSQAIYHLINLLLWLIILNFGIGLANLLPLGPVDGGRILQTSLLSFLNKKTAHKIWKWISFICLFIIIINLIFPYLRGFLLL